MKKTAFLKLVYTSEDSSKTNNYTKTLYTNMKNRGYKLSNGMRSIFSTTSTSLAAPAL
jgi:hypothetical protein